VVHQANILEVFPQCHDPIIERDVRSSAAQFAHFNRVEAGTTKARFYRDFAEILGSQAVGCRLAGIGLDDSVYFYTLENKADLVLLDLDLP
jgi:hypothetical protein